MAVEQDRELSRILEAMLRAKGCDLEAWETAIRQAVLAAGAKALEVLLEGIGCGRRGESVLCACGERMESRGVKAKTFVSMLGEVSYRRSMFQCPRCGNTRYPGDEELDLVGTTRSPGLRRMIADTGGERTFKQTSRALRELAGVEVSPKDAERVAEAIGEDIERWGQRERQALQRQEPAGLPVRSGQTGPGSPKTIETLYIEYDGTGVPMVPWELTGRKGKQEDGSAKTREAKLGCVFTQTGFDEKGRPIRDPGSTSFVGAIEDAEAFGWRIYAEALRRGLLYALSVVVICDGAQWVKNQAQLHFPLAQFIIDFYHACEHLAELSRALFGSDIPTLHRYRDRWRHYLDRGDVEKIVSEASSLLPKNSSKNKDARREIAYFDKNKEFMRYASFREQGLFIGSGVVEAGCRSLIGDRLKKSGMEWTVRGANAIIALRCLILSARFEEYWESRVA